jgi:uncharacterized protein (DUF433 family)
MVLFRRKAELYIHGKSIIIKFAVIIKDIMFKEEKYMIDRISINPNICHGKPCIVGHRIPVYMVLELIGAGISFDEIIKHYYPTLSKEDISACAEYARHVIEPEPIDNNLIEEEIVV